jgi:hypothetical protein
MEAAVNKANPKPVSEAHATVHRAYELSRNFDDRNHYKEGERSQQDAYLVKFPGSDKVRFWNAQPLKLLEPVEFDAQTDVLGRIDYLANALSWPIMSKRMLDVLRSVRDFPHQVIPLVMHETPVLSKEVGREGGPYIRTGKVSHEYVAVQLLEHLDVFDWENSVYEVDPDFPGELDGSPKKLVLKEPKNGFPPLFRTKPLEARLYVSAEGRAALEIADIRGLRFPRLRGSY